MPEAILHEEGGDPYSVSSAMRFEAITPHDVNTISKFKAIYIGGDGDLVLLNAEGDEETFVGLLAGTILPVYGNQVKATGTTATGLIALRD